MPATSANNFLSSLLKKHQPDFGPVTSLDLNSTTVARLDFSAENPVLSKDAITETETFSRVITQLLQQQNATIGIGGYLENRVIYQRSALFEEAVPRSLHLGIDIWAPAGTEVYAPLNATLHSFQDNANFGDYGPTIILQHELEGLTFYTLYGHLNRDSLHKIIAGNAIEKGQKIAEFGPYPENGDWPPHLHFQVIADLQGFTGDFPGVCKPSEVEIYSRLCPDPNLILQSRHLN